MDDSFENSRQEAIDHCNKYLSAALERTPEQYLLRGGVDELTRRVFEDVTEKIGGGIHIKDVSVGGDEIILLFENNTTEVISPLEAFRTGIREQISYIFEDILTGNYTKLDLRLPDEDELEIYEDYLYDLSANALSSERYQQYFTNLQQNIVNFIRSLIQIPPLEEPD